MFTGSYPVLLLTHLLQLEKAKYIVYFLNIEESCLFRLFY